MNTEKLDRLFENAIERRFFPSAVCVVGDAGHVYYKKAFGWKRWFPDDAPCFDVHPASVPESAERADVDTLYDMASLSKVIGTTMVAFRFLQDGKIALRDGLETYLDDVPEDKRPITLFHLMTHTSGITAHFGLESSGFSPEDAARAVLARPLSRPIGSDVEYSCMGYILLGRILERVGGAPLDVLAQREVFDVLGMSRTGYNPLTRGERNIAATEYNAGMQRYICGVVHDENARYLGGVSSNAGVFSCADDLIRFADMLSRRGDTADGRYLSASLFREAIRDYTPGMADDRGWGFQLKSDGLSCMGDLYSRGSYGHNGFTGTSLYVDYETGLYTILLTNRVHFTRASSDLYRFRRILHNEALSMVY